MTGLIVHEWIEKHGGSEKVLDSFVATFPDSEIYSLWNNAPDRYSVPVHESIISRTPLKGRKAFSLPFLPAVWKYDLPNKDFEWMLVSSHLFAHHARLKNNPDIKKFVYVHTPARYIWTPELDARGSSLPVRSIAPIFRALDRKAAQGSHKIAANSSFVRDRIIKFWDREAEVIFPPVDIYRIQNTEWSSKLNSDERRVIDALPREYIIGASRFIPYKQLDTVIRTGEIVEVPVIIAGGGPLEYHLKKLASEAKVPVNIISNPSDALLYSLIKLSSLYIFPPIEDFGIMPVEAMALNTPVVVNKEGGAKESLRKSGFGTTADFESESSIFESCYKALEIKDNTFDYSFFDYPSFSNQLKGWMGF